MNEKRMSSPRRRGSLDPLILLCAGRSERLGAPKGLVPFEGELWLGRQLKSFFTLGGQNVIVVLGYDAGLYLQQESLWKKTGSGLIDVVINDTPERGPFSSLQMAIRFLLSKEVKGAFVLPIDVPCPEKGVWQALSLQTKSDYWAVIPAFAGCAGHPVWLGRRFFEPLLKVSPEDSDGRLDRQIDCLNIDQKKIIPVTDPKVAMNLNDLASFEKFAARV